MKSKQTVIQKWKMHIYGFIVIVLAQSMALPLLNTLIKEFADLELTCIPFIAIIVTCVVVDVYFLYNRIIILRRLLNKVPIKCRLEDIFLIGYKDDKRTRYAPFPIVRSLEDHRLYLTYGKYSLLAFTATFNYSDRKNIHCTIYRSDGTLIRLGEIVDVYLLKTVDIPILIDKPKNIVKLKHRKIYFRHLNDKFSIDNFENITVFKGAVDLG